MRRRGRDFCTLGKFVEVPSPTGVEEERMENLGGASPVDFTKRSLGLLRDRTIDEVVSPRQIEVQTVACIPVRNLMLT